MQIIGNEGEYPGSRVMMTGRELQKIRLRLDMTRDEFALELGFQGTAQNNRKTIKRFETGERDVPLSVAKLAWLLAANPSTLPDWPESLVAKPLLGETA